MNKLIITLSIAFLVVFSSCLQNRNIVYLQDSKNSRVDSTYTNQPVYYKLQPNDNLHIRINSSNKDVNEFFNGNKNTNNGTENNELGLFINGSIISDSGFVSLPSIGNILVAGKTVQEAEKIIQEKVNIYLNDAVVSVKLLSYRFSVLGEVKIPGVYRNYNASLTIFDAIAMAGDITITGNVKKILIVRPTNEGNKTYRVDLTRKDILASNDLYILPNDIIYVEPIKAKAHKIDLQDLALMLSVITSIIILTNYLTK